MILIKNSQIIDGTGSPPYAADVLVNQERISAIGQFSGNGADEIIDASGAYLTPGFIDLNNDSDHYLSLFTNPQQKYFLAQGVTTIIGGQCGASLAPLVYGSLESVRKWGDPRQINVNWHTVREFLLNLDRRGLGVNFGTLTGHSTVRRALIGDSLRALTENELKVFKKLLADSFAEGSFGFSTGLGYVHGKHTPYSEIKELAELTAKSNRLYTTHLRDERGGIVDSLKETLRIARETRANVVISHFRPILGFEKEFSKALTLLEGASEKTKIHFDAYPSDASLVPIYTLFPDWLKNQNLEGMLEDIKNPAIARRVLAELPKFKDNDVVFVQAPNLDQLVGKNLKTYGKNHKLQNREAFLEIAKISKMKAVILYKNINLDLAIESLTSANALIASNSPNLDIAAEIIKHERILNAFPRFLEICEKLKLMPIEKAVERMTSRQAKILGLSERGEVKAGHMADLTILKDGVVKDVILNGRIVLKDGEMRKILAGKILKKA